MIIGLSPVYLLGGFMLHERVSEMSANPQFAGSAVAAVAPSGAAESTAPAAEDASEQAGMDATGLATADAEDSGELALTQVQPGREPTPPESSEAAAVPVAAPDAEDGDDGDEGPALRPVSDPGTRSRETDGWRTAPPAEDDDDRYASAEAALVPQPRWRPEDHAEPETAAGYPPVPRPRPANRVAAAPAPKLDVPLATAGEPTDRPSGDPEALTAREIQAEIGELRPARTAGDSRVVIHYATRGASNDARQLGSALGNAELRQVGASVSQADVRYFHPQDRAAAEAVNGMLRRNGYGSQLKDFTHFDPPPSPGTVEVWLPG